MQTLRTLLAAAATLAVTLTAQAQSNAETVSRKLDLSGFTSVDLDMPGSVEIKPGPFSVTLTTSTSSKADIKATIKGNNLVLSAKSFHIGNPYKNSHWTITMPNLEGIEVSGNGNAVVADGFSGNDMVVAVSGSGNVSGIFKATNLKVDISGSGNVSARGDAKTLVCSLSGSGNLTGEVTADKVKADLSGTGRLRLNGKAEELRCDISGSGHMDGANLATRKAVIDIGGSGSVDTNVSEELSATIGGSGSVRYKGNPSKVNSDVSGSGRVQRM